MRITQQASGLAPTAVTCPANIPVEADAVSTCTARLDGRPITSTVRQNDDQGEVNIRAACSW